MSQQLLRRAWDALDAFKQAYPESWHGDDQRVMDDLLKADLDLSGVKRPWVGLTEDETIDLAVKVGARLDLPHATKMQLQQQFIDALRKPDSLWMLFARDIEAKLKEKNT